LALRDAHAYGRHMVLVRLCLNDRDLTLADLTGQSMNLIGVHAGLFCTANYKIPMRWSRAIHTHPADVDGIRYESRMMAPDLAVVFFDRCGSLGSAEAVEGIGEPCSVRESAKDPPHRIHVSSDFADV
jgi:hypothetical protein